MASAVERFVASVTIILGTLPARRVEKKFVFPVGRENIVLNVSVYLDLIIATTVLSRLHSIGYYNSEVVSTREATIV